MAAARRLPAITSILAAALAIAAGSVPSIRASVARTTGLSAPGGTWRVIAVILAILNVKNLPFVWHIRLFRSLLYHLYLQPTELPPSALFLPLITASHTPIAETDYNFHKSNSTYFTDLDIARTHLVTAILVKGIRGIGKYPDNKTTGWSFANTTRAAGRPRIAGKPGNEVNDEKVNANEKVAERHPKPAFLQINALTGSGHTESGLNTPMRSSTPQPGSPPPSQLPSSVQSEAQQPQPDSTKTGSRPLAESQWWSAASQPGNLLVALGGNACIYHREIPLYKRFEIWTRILSWDRKWVYIVSHFVEAGAFKPPRYILQPSKGVKPWVVKGEKMDEFKGMSEEEKKSAWRKRIYASSVSKYVVKKGRLTIPPELVLQRSEMLPPKPPGAKSTFEMGYMPPKMEEGKQEQGTPESGSTFDVLEESLFQNEDSEDEWTWEKCERMRLKGLKLAQHFDALDGLRKAFDGGEDGVMGVFTDLVGNI